MKHHKLLQLIRDNVRGQDSQDDSAPAVRVDTTGAKPQLYLYGVIDEWFGVGAVDVIQALAPLRDQAVDLHINSPGGDVFEGTAIAAAIAAHPQPITAHIDALAASAATRVALAAHEVHMADSALMMIHEGWTIAWGNKRELMHTAGLLAKVDTTIAADYARKTGKPLDQINTWLEAETWFTAAEAKDAGFIDAITSTTQAGGTAARWNLSAYRNAPKLAAPPPKDDDTEQLQAQLQQQLQLNRNRARLLFPN